MAKVRVPQWGRLDKFYWVDEVAAASSGSSATTSTAATTTVTNPVAPPLTPPRQTLDKIPDGTAYAKPLSSQLTSGGIDFSKSGFLNKNIDNIGDGMTYLRMPGANMDTNRRGLIDFTQGGHVGKVIDNMGDGTFAKVLKSRLQNGVPVLPAPANNLVPNATFSRNNVGTPNNTTLALGAPATDGWVVANTAGGGTVAWLNNSGYSGTGCLQFLWTGGSVIPNGASYPAFTTVDRVPVQSGDVISLGMRAWWNYNTSLPAGVTVEGVFYAVFYDVNGAMVGSPLAVSTGNNAYGYNNVASGNPATASTVVPANVVAMGFTVQCNVNNTTGASVTLAGTSSSIPALIIFSGLYATQQLRDQTNLLPILSAGAQTVWQNLSITYTASAGTPASATISVTAAQILGLLPAGGLVSYNASSASVTGTGGTSPTYYLYYLDPAYSGGTQTLYATTVPNNLRGQLGIVYIGSVVVAFPASGTGSGSGIGGLCIADDMWIEYGLRAGDAIPGDWFDCVDLPTGAGMHRRRLLAATRGVEECVRLVTTHGAALVCSISTPFDTPDGRTLLAPDMLGEGVLTDRGIEAVADVQPVGPCPVSRIHLGGVSYAAGENPRYRIYSHNATQKP